MICVGRTRVKICGITSARDARFAVAAGADAIGLVLYDPSPRNVSIEQARDICAQLPAFVTVVALCVDKPAVEVNTLLQALPVDLLQFHGSEDAEYCSQFDRPYMKAVRVAAGMDVDAEIRRYPGASAILLDTYRKGVPGGTGEQFDWELIPASQRSRVVLAGGLNPGNIASAIDTVGPYAVDVSGGVEAAPGVKDAGKINAFMQQVALADASAGR